MEKKDRATSPPKPLEEEPGIGRGAQARASQTVQWVPARGFRVSIDSPICRECLGAIAHRLAQPMTALRGSIELGLMGKRTAEEYHSILVQTLQLADNMVKTIVSLRDLGESIGPDGPTDRANLKFVVSETLAEIESLARMKTRHFTFEAGQTSDAKVSALGLREVLRSLMMWILQNTSADGTIVVKLSLAEGTTQIHISLPRLDLQYLQVKMLDDITPPDVHVSPAARTGSLDWSGQQQAINALGGKLDVLMEGADPTAICISFPIAPPDE